MDSSWKEIKDAPQNQQILIRFYGSRYVSDVYHSWWDSHQNKWAKWPHNFGPTHWIDIPE